MQGKAKRPKDTEKGISNGLTQAITTASCKGQQIKVT